MRKNRKLSRIPPPRGKTRRLGRQFVMGTESFLRSIISQDGHGGLGKIHIDCCHVIDQVFCEYFIYSTPLAPQIQTPSF